MAAECDCRVEPAPFLFASGVHTLATAALVACLATQVWTQDSNGKRPNAKVEYRNTAPGVRYVGSETCKRCHATIYAQYSHTAMGQSASLPAKLLDMGWLAKPLEIFNERENRRYQVLARGGKVYESEYGVDGSGQETFRHTEELAYVVGTGANGVTPIVRRGNYLFQAPVSYYTAKKAWDLSPNYEVRDLGFSLPVTADCIGCHTGRTQPVAGREGLYGDPPVLELAIGCERCHGPGELHVLERQSGEPVASAPDPTIVNPARLSRWLADNICMSCHEGDIRALQPGKTEGDFRPGTPLNDTVAILKAPIDPKALESPLLEHYYSMTLSKCYQGSKGKLGCQSCHDPHVQPSVEDSAAYFRRQCLRCHSEQSCTLDPQKRLAQQPSDACSTCHMQRQPALTVAHSTLTDHRIVRLPGEPYPESAFKAAPNTGFIHVNAVPGMENKIPAVSLLRAYRQELVRSHLEYKDYYFSLLDQLSQSNHGDPFVLSAIAQRALSDREVTKATRYARQVIDQGSTSVYDYLFLDQLLAQAGEFTACVDLLKKGLAMAPYNNLFYESLAARELAAGRRADGVATIKRGLELFPEDSVLRDLDREVTARDSLH